MLAGTVALFGSELVRLTTKPAGAGPLRVMLLPVVTLLVKLVAGERVIFEIVTWLSVRVALTAGVDPYAAVMVTVVFTLTFDVCIVNGSETDVPAAILTVGGTVTKPAFGPAVPKVIVPVAV